MRATILLLMLFACVTIAADRVSLPTMRILMPDPMGPLGPFEPEEPTPYVVNGDETGYLIYKSVIGIMSGGSLCTATLIDAEVLLTAGHCVYLYENNQLVIDSISNPGDVTVKGGADILWGGTTLAKGKAVVKHSTWVGTINSYSAVDLALIHLDRKVTSLDPVPVREAPDEYEGQEAVVVGYGITSSNANDSGTHRWGETTILNMGTIMGKPNLFEIGNPSGVCQGDSGGPLLTQQNGGDVVSGVASFVTGECSATSGSYHTRTLPYRDWIESVVQQFTGHGFISAGECGDGDDVCTTGQTKDCSELDAHYASGTAAPCNSGCYWWDISVCTPKCGDNFILPPEPCELGDTTDCAAVGAFLPGTNATCAVDCSGWNTAACTATACGDGVKEGNEFCDTQLTSCETLGAYNEDSYARCKSDCTGYDVADCDNQTIVCGNDTVDPLEECDDGNTTGGDGCSSKCKEETPPDVDTALPDDTVTDEDQTDQSDQTDQTDQSIVDNTVTDETVTPDNDPGAVCGDGTKEGTEECDDGNLIPGDGCNPDCTLPPTANENCGNGMIDLGEECDDGNLIPGDGCNPDCTKPEVPVKRNASNGCALTVL